MILLKLLHIFSWLFQIECWLTAVFLAVSSAVLSGYPPTHYLQLFFWTEFATVFFMKIFTSILDLQLQSPKLNSLRFLIVFLGFICSLVLAIFSLLLVYDDITQEDVRSYTVEYYKKYHKIPRFLHYFQHQFSCCGIENYKDYQSGGIMPFPGVGYVTINRTTKELKSTTTESNIFPPGVIGKREITATSAYDLDNVYISITVSENFSAFNVPFSCCTFANYWSEGYETCGIGIVIGQEEEDRLNSVTKGCFKIIEKFSSTEPKAVAVWVVFYLMKVIPTFHTIHAFVLLLMIVLIYKKRQSLNAVRPSANDDDTASEEEYDVSVTEAAELMIPVEAVALGISPNDPLAQQNHPTIVVNKSGKTKKEHRVGSTYSFSDDEEPPP